jgi:8-oxo-dGTP diphosphatase
MSAPVRERHAARLVTLSFVLHGEDVLLLRHRETSDRFAGRWNGIGGHVEPGECIAASARRELREEAGLEVEDLVLRGVVHEAGLLGHAHVLFVFRGRARERELRPLEGHALRWQPLARVGELPLVPDVAPLLEHALADGDPFFAIEHFDGGDRATRLEFGPGDREFHVGR